MRGTHQYIPGHTAIFAMCLEKMLFRLQDFLHESFILVSQNVGGFVAVFFWCSDIPEEKVYVLLLLLSCFSRVQLCVTP